LKQSIASPLAPKPVGPYSAALRVGQLLFVSGQVPLDPATGRMVEGSEIAVHTRRVLENVGALLEAAGLSYAAVVRSTVFLADMNDFQAMNEVYATFFKEPYPARSTVQAARLPRDARVEVDVIASYEV
jgi:2-iminobutanoate/2-iminopropanoate deaminase